MPPLVPWLARSLAGSFAGPFANGSMMPRLARSRMLPAGGTAGLFLYASTGVVVGQLAGSFVARPLACWLACPLARWLGR